MAGGEDYNNNNCCSDSDDDDLDRFEFLPRLPAPPAEEGARPDDGSDDETDDDDEGGGGGDGGPVDRPVLLALPKYVPQQTPTSSADQAPSSCSPRVGDPGSESFSGSEGSREEEEVQRADPRRGKGKNKTKPPSPPPLPRVCGKRGRTTSPGCEEDDREPRRNVAATSAGRFPCNQCERCFDSHQALGGHVLGHQKKARIAAIAAAATVRRDASGGRGNCKPDFAVVELERQDVNGVGHAEQKTSAAAHDGNGRCHRKKAFEDADDEACHEDINGVGHKKAKKKKKKPCFVAEDHMGADGDCSFDPRASVVASSHKGADDDHDGNRPETASSRGFYNGSGKTAIGAGGTHNDDGAVKNTKAGASDTTAADGNSNNGDACRGQQYKCKVCGTLCLTGQALGGHMRKHRKQLPLGVGGDAGPAATNGKGRIPVSISRQFAAPGWV